MESNMQPACWLCDSVRGRLRKGTMGSANTSALEKAVSQLLPWCWTIQFLSICLCCLPIYCHTSGAQREWVRVNLFMNPLRGMALDSSSFCFPLPQFLLTLRSEVVDTYLSWTGTLGWGSCWSWDPSLLRYLFQFYWSHISVRPTHSTSLPHLPASMWSPLYFHNCRSSFHLNVWQFWMMVVL